MTKKINRYSADHPFVVASYEMRARGMSVNQIADAIGIHKVQVWRFLRTPAYDPENRAPPPSSPAARATTKPRPVSVQGLIVKTDDNRPIDLQSVVCEKCDGGDRFVVTVFVPHPAP